MSESANTVIIGAGLAGLSAALERKEKALVLEANSEPGGKARSITTESGAVFDFTGHLLHLRNPEIIALVETLLPDAFDRIERRAAIFMEDRFLNYPFQANFHPLSPTTVKQCLLGFVRAWNERKVSGERTEFSSFADWALSTFGDGICEHFLFPYNNKLYCTDPAEMSAEWVSWSVPQPDIEAVIEGALGIVQEGLGYNASFLYPRSGGIELLPRTMADRLESIRYDTRVSAIITGSKTVIDSAGTEYKYSDLISTVPLHQLAAITDDMPAELKQAASELRYVNVYNINFVLKDRPEWPWQWLYLPEDQFRCYRIGVSSNITAQLAPGNSATVYTEVSYLPGERPDEDLVRQEVIGDLKRIGLVRTEDDILEEAVVDLDCAYVVFNHHRAEWLPRILQWFAERNVTSTGRWGAWEYGGMEDAMWQGVQAARKA
jgi:protoporphyrinogen oxidase